MIKSLTAWDRDQKNHTELTSAEIVEVDKQSKEKEPVETCALIFCRKLRFKVDFYCECLPNLNFSERPHECLQECLNLESRKPKLLQHF